MILEIKNLSCGYGEKIVVKDLSFTVKSGEILCILGSNGIGKTTFFKTMLGFLKTKGGQALLDGENILDLKEKDFAKLIAYVPQAHTPPFPYKVIDVVVMGRTAHLGVFASPSKKDYNIALKSLESLGIEYLKDKPYTMISGGERQLVLIARALTQNAKLLIMDEPTSNLDYGNQMRVLKRIKMLANKDMAIIMTSHFPDHALISATNILLMGKNYKYEYGSSKEMITSDNLKKLYNIDVQIEKVLDRKNNKNIDVCVPII